MPLSSLENQSRPNFNGHRCKATVLPCFQSQEESEAEIQNEVNEPIQVNEVKQLEMRTKCERICDARSLKSPEWSPMIASPSWTCQMAMPVAYRSLNFWEEVWYR